MKKLKYIILTILILSCYSVASAQQIAIKTNGLMLLALTPNLECELVTGEHSSFNVGAFGHKKPYGIDSKVVGLQAEYRYWFNGRPMTREYIGVAALGSSYDMQIKDHVYDGDAIGLGLTAGYSISLGRKFNLEFYGGFGVLAFAQKFYYKYDNYEDYFPDGNISTNSKGFKLFPTKLGISISYIIN